MAYSKLEDAIVNNYFDVNYPPLEPEEPSLEGMQLAAGPSSTMTDAGVRLGRAGVTKQQSEAAGGLEKPLGAMLDMGAATVKGVGQSFVGLGGDFEMIGRGVAEIFNRGAGEDKIQAFMRGIQQKTILPKTDEIKKWLDKNVGMVNEGKNPYESIGEIVAPGGYVKGTKKVLEGAKAVGTALAPTAANMMESGLRKSGMIMDAVPVENYVFVAADTAARVDNGTVKLSKEVSNEKKFQLDPKYRVSVQDAYEPQGNGQNIINDVNPGNIEDISFRLDNLAQTFPDPLESQEKFSAMLATVYNSTDVPMPPKWLVENVNDIKKWSTWFGSMSKNQLDEADRGFAVVDKFKKIYTDGTAKADTTGRLMFWAMLSRMASAYPHESGFLDLAEKMNPFIQKAISGNYTQADIDAGLKMVKQTIPAGSPGKQVTSNANAFLDTFLPKMAADAGDGRSKLQALHDMIADPNMTGPQIRRAFYGLAEGVGIKNKVLSFALLVSGREDVMVLDRIQINRLFAGGDKIYDDVNQIFDGGPGLAIYEGMERSIASRIKTLYKSVGRENQASVGRYHWESWVLSSGQEVAHPTLESIVKSARGEANPYANVPVMEGRTHKTAYGVTYEKMPDGSNRFVYTGSNGNKYAMNKPQLDKLFKLSTKGKNRATPEDFPGVNFFEKDTLPDGTSNPYFGKSWYEWPGVNRDRIDKLAASLGTKLDTGSGTGSVEATSAGSVANGSKRSAGRKASVTGGGKAPAPGAE
jgi:hypothetical protein